MTEPVTLEVYVNVGAFSDAPEALLEAAVLRTLDDQRVRVAEISLTLVDDEGIRALNKQYLAKDRATDVLAFTLGSGPGTLGDVYLGMDQARRQAEGAGVSLDEELVRLAVHGTLHVLGHEHPEGSDRTTSPMFTLQERLVESILGR